MKEQNSCWVFKDLSEWWNQMLSQAQPDGGRFCELDWWGYCSWFDKGQVICFLLGISRHFPYAQGPQSQDWMNKFGIQESLSFSCCYNKVLGRKQTQTRKGLFNSQLKGIGHSLKHKLEAAGHIVLTFRK